MIEEKKIIKEVIKRLKLLTRGYICNTFAEIYLTKSKNNIEMTIREARCTVLNRYPRFKQWIIDTGKSFNEDYEYPSAWTYSGKYEDNQYEVNNCEVSIEDKLKVLKEYFKENYGRKDNEN